MIGFEPTTFTLATCSAPDTNALAPKDLAVRDQPQRSAYVADVQMQQPIEVPEDPRLLEIVKVWDGLDENTKVKVYEMVKSARAHGDAQK